MNTKFVFRLNRAKQLGVITIRGPLPHPCRHPDVDLKSKETVSFCAILVGCFKSSAHPVADHHAAESWSSEESVAASLWE